MLLHPRRIAQIDRLTDSRMTGSEPASEMAAYVYNGYPSELPKSHSRLVPPNGSRLSCGLRRPQIRQTLPHQAAAAGRQLQALVRRRDNSPVWVTYPLALPAHDRVASGERQRNKLPSGSTTANSRNPQGWSTGEVIRGTSWREVGRPAPMNAW